MKKRIKHLIGAFALLIGAVTLTGCTTSFCSVNDQSNMLTAYDNGVSAYYAKGGENVPEGAIQHPYFNNVVYTISYDNNCGGIQVINKTCTESNISIPHIDFWAALDYVVVTDICQNKDVSYDDFATIVFKESYKKFSSSAEKPALWDNWEVYVSKACALVGDYSKCPSVDYTAQYKTSMNTYLNTARSCIATEDGYYGNFGINSDTQTYVEAKDYQYGWSKGFFEGLLVWPIGAFIDVLVKAFQPAGNGLNGTTGWAQLLAIVVVTIVVRAIMFLVSFKSTMGNAKMTELQPEIAKIQNKYPNAKNNQNEKMRMSQEMNKLYKKNGINPFSTLIVAIIQFPVFICVWGALSGSAWLATGSFLNLNLSESISSALFNTANWANGSAETALVLFLLMAAAQVVSMLLPQWMQKSRAKKVAKLGKNPSATSQNNKMKWFTYIMMAMIIFMGFSLASAMGVYWLVGALFSIAQTLIVQKISDKKSLKEKKI